MHADWTLLPRGQFPQRAQILLGAEIELASSFVKFFLDWPALLLMLLPVFVLTFLVAIPNALAGRALLDSVTLLAARRTQLGWGPVRVVFVFRFGFTLSFDRFAERHGAELLSGSRCSVLFR